MMGTSVEFSKAYTAKESFISFSNLTTPPTLCHWILLRNLLTRFSCRLVFVSHVIANAIAETVQDPMTLVSLGVPFLLRYNQQESLRIIYIYTHIFLDPGGLQMTQYSQKELLKIIYIYICIWVVVKIVVPFWVLSIVRHIVFRGLKRGPQF